MRVLFTSVPLAGHFLPLVPLAWAFRAAGHEVLVATTGSFLPTVLRTGLPAVPCASDERFRDQLAEVMSGTPEQQRRAHGRAFGALAAAGRDGVRDVVRRWRPDLVVSERAEFAGPLAAAEHDIPWVQYHWSVSDLRELARAAAEALGPEMAGLPAPVAVLDPWPAHLRLPHAAGHHGIRHVPHNGDVPVPPWVFLPRERPRVCLTLGTVLPRFGHAAPDLVTAMIESLGPLGVEVVVAVDEDVAAGWPPLPGHVTHVGRLPLGEVLSACDAVIHHGGQGTALTAMLAGCPQLALPHVDDQFDNAEMVAKSGAGIALMPGEAAPDAVAKACEALLHVVGHGSAAASLAELMATSPAPAEVVSLLTEGRADESRRAAPS
ncbi:nucleotide disphospho-sugar-binding domain-containing protein [Sphaerisporangium dianthi]|uniref:Nucleotide disphospho-sugar-binding domain-containing protein n=1 Tax=Sphaerisporangium dianthi TaxID=1436120 RepID=A0ABV9CTA8_9ACTN